ncbi:MAG: sel1 repeat family protein [Proteobacteria bacterium]|nr:sel1 repeat family protein [Pseudomonadota bacterium]
MTIAPSAITLGFAQDDRKAIGWYRKAADAGNTDVMTFLGQHYTSARGVERDHVEAARWYGRAAERGDTGGGWSLMGRRLRMESASQRTKR